MKIDSEKDKGVKEWRLPYQNGISEAFYYVAAFLATIKNMEDQEGKTVNALSRTDGNPLNMNCRPLHFRISKPLSSKNLESAKGVNNRTCPTASLPLRDEGISVHISF